MAFPGLLQAYCTFLLQCSADYCGNYRFKTDNGTRYKYHPDLINKTQTASLSDGKLECYLNPHHSEAGAYLYLNEAVEKPEDRMFRWYEGWLLLIAPLAISLAILLFIASLFFRGKLSAPPVQRPKETFGM